MKSKFRIYGVSLQMVGEVAALAKRIERKDRDLARQLRRSSAAVPLNMSEGMHLSGGNRTARYRTAMAEAAEAATTLLVAQASGYLDGVDLDATLDRLEHIKAVMWKMTH